MGMYLLIICGVCLIFSVFFVPFAVRDCCKTPEKLPLIIIPEGNNLEFWFRCTVLPAAEYYDGLNVLIVNSECAEEIYEILDKLLE